MIFPLLATTLADVSWRPFFDPLPVWQNSRWPWLIIPLCLGVSLVYKSARCKTMGRVLRETLSITVTIVVGMAAAALVLGLLVRGLEHWH